MEKTHPVTSITPITTEEAERLYPDDPEGFAIGFNLAILIVERLNGFVNERESGYENAQNSDLFMNIKPNK